MLTTCRPNARRNHAFCPFHEGSTGYDLIIDPLYGRFSCIVCGTCGWTEDGWERWLLANQRVVPYREPHREQPQKDQPDPRDKVK